MSIEVALIDFPRLQEQIASRLLADHEMNSQRISFNEAKDRLGIFNLIMFFWPDTSKEALERLKMLHDHQENKQVPVVLVTSEVGKHAAEAALGTCGAVDILITPLQPHIVKRKLANLLGIRRESPAASTHLDVAHINPFIDATLDTLKQMAGMTCDRTNLRLQTDAKAHGDISGVMGLSGDADGFVAITFANGLARKIVCKMLQIETGEETEADIMDGVGELMNMIAGAAKADLVNTKHSFQLTLPNVIVGGPHGLGQPRGGVPVVVIEFSTDRDKFELMVCLRPKNK